MPEVRGPTDLEKRLKILRSQVSYGGKGAGGRSSTPRSLRLEEQQGTDENRIQHSDLTYLKQDLLKISLLASGAVGIQFLLYISLQNNLIKLPI